MILAGDVGGTKINLAVFESLERAHTPLHKQRLKSADYPDFESAVLEYLKTPGLPPIEAACFGVAGPVIDRKAHITNLDWMVDASQLEAGTKISHIELINDLEAFAVSIPFLLEKHLIPIQSGQVDPRGARAIIAPGTGLGEAYATWDGSKYLAHPSEGGHSDFCPNDQLQARLLLFLLKRFPRVSCERVCSGSGFPNLYEFLRDEIGEHPESSAFRQKIEECEDPTPLLMEAALSPDQTNPLCRATLDLFLSILGAETGNMALNFLARGGVYLGGGIPPRIAPHLRKGPFLTAFRRKGRLHEMMQTFPIYIIDNPEAALLGAAVHAFSLS